MGALSPMMIASLTASFLAVALMSGTAAYLVLEGRSPERLRVQKTIQRAATMGTGPASLTDQASPVVRRIASFVPKSPKELNKIRRRLMRAGYHSMTAAVVFSISELIVPVVLVVPVLLFVNWPTALLVAGFAGLVGFMIPSLVLGHLIEKRRQIISNGLPDVLDLLIVCLEAGCSLDQAITKATEELSLTYPPLGEELRMLSTETRAGKPRIEAFRNFEARTKNEDVKSLVAMLVQTDRFGTSVSQALRTFAEVARTKRRQRAEEKAAKVGVKMVFPLVLCLFPALYVVTLGPAVIQIVRVFIQQIAR